MLFVISIWNLETLKYHVFKKALALSIICSDCDIEEEKIFKEEKSMEISKILCLIKSI